MVGFTETGEELKEWAKLMFCEGEKRDRSVDISIYRSICK